ncbi:DUF1514 family protein [Staphylococcus warneri]|jgi:hypothetical protein|uniref:DUF1514 family protein n=1 Tax=Staphylococcus warneri TaxID=1292 RepID=UPI000F52E6AD|nr:DUF1514 family protein [Staphylococcus warneri]MCD8803117.1 DUF1514 family protein [Staphylococcus warneri]MCD8806469.1 DUF1514 family protein [Staphylococcus warneri]MCI2788461.1 DUF1514 family protein [Staphylococcus warneri]MDH8712993.1 DUF1514 family protein [Staphylococcus epidermidis]
MWIIISILLGVVCLISLGVQHEQRKELEEYKYANAYMKDYIVRYIDEKRK